MSKFDGSGFTKFIINVICLLILASFNVVAWKRPDLILIPIWFICGIIEFIRNAKKGVKSLIFLQIDGGILTLLVSFFIH